MKSHLKAKLEYKHAYLKNYESERNRYLQLRDKFLSHSVNYSYYQNNIDKCNRLISGIKKEIEALERELKECPLKDVFKKSIKMTGIEYRDNSR